MSRSATCRKHRPTSLHLCKTLNGSGQRGLTGKNRLPFQPLLGAQPRSGAPLASRLPPRFCPEEQRMLAQRFSPASSQFGLFLHRCQLATASRQKIPAEDPQYRGNRSGMQLAVLHHGHLASCALFTSRYK